MYMLQTGRHNVYRQATVAKVTGKSKQEAQLSQRDRAMFRVTEYVAKSQDVCLSVCLSVTRWYCIKTAKHVKNLFHRLVATPL